MNYWILVDIVLIAVFVSCVYLVARSGLVKALAFCLACVIAAAGSYFITGRLWQWGSEKIFSPLTEKLIVAVIGDDPEDAKYEYLDTAVTTFETALEKIKEKFLTKEGEEAGQSESVPVVSVNEDGEVIEEEKTSIGKITELVGKYCSIIFVFWLFFALILALARVGIDELSFVNRIPVVGITNQVLGILAGVVLGYMVISAPVHLIEKLFGSLDLQDAGKLTSSAVINYIMKTLG